MSLPANIIPVILSGGSGTRLWPQSRQYLPKPFAPLFETPLFHQTAKRVSHWGEPLIVTSKRLQALTEHALGESNLKAKVLYEPSAKNTAPAIAWLCWELMQNDKGHQVVAIFPSDHLIQDHKAFWSDIEAAAQMAQTGRVVILGIPANKPETGFGYIEKSQALSDSKHFGVQAFHEKPSLSKANDYVTQGFLWNAGIFVAQVQTLWSHFQKHLPALATAVAKINPESSNLAEVYESLEPISIDYGIMEKLGPQELAVLPASFDWSDLGTWDAIAASPAQTSPSVSVEASQVQIYGQKGKTYSVIGAQNLIIVDTEDAMLVTQAGQSQKVSQVFEILKKENPQVVERHVFEQRPWGDFRVLAEDTGFKTKTITVLPGAQLSYQSHEHRSEHWVVAQGKAEVILDGTPHILNRGDYIFIKAQQKHQLRNIGDLVLRVVEVQIGDYLGEDDITRYNDKYGRA